ncbi:MAG: (2Fe-2S)-binding protein [Candidatus Omnitrophica bacterium]|nr:(2Fe-2S)-binding protein [Candidatus Omnitrophota bacterium]
MAKLIIDRDEYHLPDGAAIGAVCEQAGIPFCCNTGVCGACKVEVLDGAENLSELTEEEKALGMDRKNRLSCQCCIKRGTVKITY